jgi:hypothetical protein
LSVLFRQPHGFEGFPQVEVVVTSPDQSIAQGHHDAHPRAYLDSAALPLEGTIHDGDDPVRTGIDQLGDRDYVVPGGLQELVPGFRSAQVPPVRLGRKGGRPLHFAMHETHQCLGLRRKGARLIRGRVGVGLLPICLPDLGLGLEEAPHDLHVLLRHRPRSIPQAQEST